MAETYSTEYTGLYITKPPAKQRHINLNLRFSVWTYTQVLTGTAADTLKIGKLPAGSILLPPLCVFAFAGFTSGMTLSVGWGAYTDFDGVVQAASATGIFNASDVSNGTGMLHGGMQTGATPDDDNPAVMIKDFRNATAVDIYATFGSQAPGANATLTSILVYGNEG